MATINIIPTPIHDVTVELQPIFGDIRGGVLHMIPGGIQNPEGFGDRTLDLYAFAAQGKQTFRGGHYHPVLNELFFLLSGTALWILSDMRENSPTHGITTALLLSMDLPAVDAHDAPVYAAANGSLPRLRVPAGVYHAIFPLTDERVVCVAVGSTRYDKEDYRSPHVEEIPGMQNILDRFGIHAVQKSAGSTNG